MYNSKTANAHTSAKELINGKKRSPSSLALEHAWNAIAERRKAPRVCSGSSISILPTPVDRRGLKWRGCRVSSRGWQASANRRGKGDDRPLEGEVTGQGRGFPAARLAPVYTTNAMDDSSAWLNLFLIQWLPSWPSLGLVRNGGKRFCPAERAPSKPSIRVKF